MQSLGLWVLTGLGLCLEADSLVSPVTGQRPGAGPKKMVTAQRMASEESWSLQGAQKQG